MLSNEINQNVNDLIQFELDKGVSPFDLMHNIVEDDYKEVSIKKQKDGYTCDVKFIEHDEFKDINKLIYRYMYDNQMKLMQISIINNKNIKVAWTRESEEKKLLSKILYTFDNVANKQSFINTLPESLKNLIQEKDELISL